MLIAAGILLAACGPLNTTSTINVEFKDSVQGMRQGDQVYLLGVPIGEAGTPFAASTGRLCRWYCMPPASSIRAVRFCFFSSPMRQSRAGSAWSLMSVKRPLSPASRDSGDSPPGWRSILNWGAKKSIHGGRAWETPGSKGLLGGAGAT